MEAIFAEFVACGDFGVDWVGVDVWWDSGVEGRVEEGDVEGIGKLICDSSNDCEGGGIVPIG